jgi:hypothetical protein
MAVPVAVRGTPQIRPAQHRHHPVEEPLLPVDPMPMPMPMPAPSSPGPAPDSGRLVGSGGQRASAGPQHGYVFEGLPLVTLVSAQEFSVLQTSAGSHAGVVGSVVRSAEDTVFRPD